MARRHHSFQGYTMWSAFRQESFYKSSLHYWCRLDTSYRTDIRWRLGATIRTERPRRVVQKRAPPTFQAPPIPAGLPACHTNYLSAHVRPAVNWNEFFRKRAADRSGKYPAMLARL